MAMYSKYLSSDIFIPHIHKKCSGKFFALFVTFVKYLKVVRICQNGLMNGNQGCPKKAPMAPLKYHQGTLYMPAGNPKNTQRNPENTFFKYWYVVLIWQNGLTSKNLGNPKKMIGEP